VKPIILQVRTEPDREQLDGKLFQVDVLPDFRIKLSPVSVRADQRCQVVINGERCSGAAGHTGKHFWAGGD
jgi:hypothetical protein